MKNALCQIDSMCICSGQILIYYFLDNSLSVFQTEHNKNVNFKDGFSNNFVNRCVCKILFSHRIHLGFLFGWKIFTFRSNVFLWSNVFLLLWSINKAHWPFSSYWTICKPCGTRARKFRSETQRCRNSFCGETSGGAFFIRRAINRANIIIILLMRYLYGYNFRNKEVPHLLIITNVWKNLRRKRSCQEIQMDKVAG